MYLDFIRVKNEYIAASRKAFASGLAAAAGGNISAAIPGTKAMLVKPSGISLGEVDEENLIITDFDGNLKEGRLKPTKETLLHGGIYKHFSDAGGIVHVHPLYSMICANSFEELPLVTKQMKQVMNVSIPILKLKSLTVDEEGMEEVYRLLSCNNVRCFLLEEHGAVTIASSVMEAEYMAELVEEDAMVYWNLKLLDR